MSLHNETMNLPCNATRYDAEPKQRLAYKEGHRDARHAAAEIAIVADAAIASRDAEIASLKNAQANAAAGWEALLAENARLRESVLLTDEQIKRFAVHAADRIPESNYIGRVLHVVRMAEDHLSAARKKGLAP